VGRPTRARLSRSPCVTIPTSHRPLRRSNEQVGLFLAFIAKVVISAFAAISAVFVIGAVQLRDLGINRPA